MMVNNLNFSKYGVSREAGFLPEEPPLNHLTDIYFQPWEETATHIQHLIERKVLRKVIECELPQLDVNRLKNDIREWRRAYCLLTFIANAYIWSSTPPRNILPDNIATPLLKISEKLGLPPLITYSSVVLWNYKLRDDKSGVILDNLDTCLSFTGTTDESWFYLISVYFEKLGGKCISHIEDVIDAMLVNNTERVTLSLKLLAHTINELIIVLRRLPEKCDPNVFYFQVRPFLAGWKNMARVGLPNGVKYGSSGSYQLWAGGSNAQSSLIQMLDIFLGIKHFGPHKSQVSKTEEHSNQFLDDMRNYMPRPHRDFLEHLSQIENVKCYLNKNHNPGLILAYDCCITFLKTFRDVHLNIVKQYVIIPAKRDKKQRSESVRYGLASAGDKETGTGGTMLLPFLTQCKEETTDAAITSWLKNILKGTESSPKVNSNSTDRSLSMNFQFDYNHNFVGFTDEKVKMVTDPYSSENDVDYFIGHW